MNKKIEQDLSLVEEGYKIIRLINEFTPEKYPLPTILKLAENSFQCLDFEKKTGLILLTFQIKFFTTLGYLPFFDHCLKCEQKLTDSINFFDLENLGILCEKCLPQIALTQKISFPLIKTINFLQKSGFSQGLKIKLEKPDLNFLNNLLEKITQKIKDR